MAAAQKVYPINNDEEKATHQHERKLSDISEKGESASYNSGHIIHFRFARDVVIPTRKGDVAPRYESRPPERRRNFCCRCLLWSFCVFLLLIVMIAIAAAILYAVIQPRVPKISVETIQITSFAVGTDSTVSSQFVVGVRARNSNKKVGIHYLDDSYLAVFYTGTELCRGKLRAFYQGHKNTTNVDITFACRNVQVTDDFVTSLNAEQQQGKILLRLMADVPVKVKLGKLKTPKISYRVRCDIVVDKLAHNTTVNIIENKCKS
ncbi:hypothetical protein KI387_034275 [Taxus chinensis]|uniref:Late embryogenesis abundant protein LEA-2 subgroup domain-containing protein n=1 Tax=Taxus chinensis TaxID=29808 RepID=A0AA38C0E3_TAXCH|nr:hypothetical protein KI387_034275 [Taxus chinensis]